MDTSTGEIYKVFGDGTVTDGQDQQKGLDEVRAKFMKLIPEKYLPELQSMNRKDRREFYRTHKKEFGSLKAAGKERKEG